MRASPHLIEARIAGHVERGSPNTKFRQSLRMLGIDRAHGMERSVGVANELS